MNDVPIFVDLRPLQDGNYKYRGVGFCITSILRARAGTAATAHELIGLIDPDFEAVPPEYAALVDSLSECWNRAIRPEGAVFVSGSPMTHDPTLTMRFTGHPRGRHYL